MLSFLGELIFELIFEGIVEASASSRLPKILRYILKTVICIFYISINALFVYIGISLLKDKNILGGIATLLLASAFIVMTIMAYRKVYIERK